MSFAIIFEYAAALIVGLGAGGALFAIWLRTTRPVADVARAAMLDAEDSIVFLFDDEEIVDATPLAKTLIAKGDPRRSDWENFVALLAHRFPHLRSQCQDLATRGRIVIRPEGTDRGWIEAEYWKGVARLTIFQSEHCPEDMLDPLAARAMEHELETLRMIGEVSPQLIWKRDAEGSVIWANKAYIDLSDAMNPIAADGVRSWPPSDIFPHEPVVEGREPKNGLIAIKSDAPENDRWFEITAIKRAGETLFFAIDKTDAVYAKTAQTNFVQTLSKTFAQLSVGLAIFDGDRRLAMFNPALLDLTGLPADRLIMQPTLSSFLDSLRQNQMIPEPRDYRSWRDEMLRVEAEAEDGTYSESWPLPNGQTFRVTGRPHPDGAVAFLFEDISEEISLTRHYRSLIDIDTAVLDNLGEAVCVFSKSGEVILTNRAYRSLFERQDTKSLHQSDFSEEAAIWKRNSAPTPVWERLSRIVQEKTLQGEWQDDLYLTDGRQLRCRYARLQSGAHQVMWSVSSDPQVVSDDTASRKAG